MNHVRFYAEARAISIARSLGYRCAAGYLRNRGFGFVDAYFALFGRFPRRA